jgi:predicted DNA binding CopG/RHH family protein
MWFEICQYETDTQTDTLTIRFAHEDIQRLRQEADEQGVGPSTLARMLVKKGLRTL